MRSNIVTALSMLALSMNASGVSIPEGKQWDEQTLINRPNIDTLLNYSELEAMEERVMVSMVSTTCCASGTCDIIQDWDGIPCTPENYMYIGACP